MPLALRPLRGQTPQPMVPVNMVFADVRMPNPFLESLSFDCGEPTMSRQCPLAKMIQFLSAAAILFLMTMPVLALDADGFETIFGGKNLEGWHVSAESGHSATSGKKWWKVGGQGWSDRGSQDVPGNGGIILSNKEYGNFEVRLEMKNDFGPDSGLFLRSTEDGRCYQAMIDYHANGNLMGIYGEGLGGNPHLRNFSFWKQLTRLKWTVLRCRCQSSPKSGRRFGIPMNGMKSALGSSEILRQSPRSFAERNLWNTPIPKSVWPM